MDFQPEPDRGKAFLRENRPFLNNQIFLTIQPTEVIIQPAFLLQKRKEIRMQARCIMNSFMSWIGGKKALRDEIVVKFPAHYSRYIEVFGGGGWVLFHKAPGNDFEVYNDFNPNLATSSCCPAFVRYIKSAFPDLLPLVSHNLSPMVTLAKYLKSTDEKAKVVFIGPCTAKKAEAQLESVKPYIDAVITFEELQALFDSKDLDITTLREDVLDNASYFGRIFARSGGLSDAVAQGLKEQNIEFDLKAIPCDGIEECRIALLKKSKNVLDANFIEGMACIGGCIGGAGCLTHGEKNKAEVDKYGKEALEKTIRDAVSILK